jgi:hypothetical protein
MTGGTRQDETRQDETRQDETRQDETRQDMARAALPVKCGILGSDSPPPAPCFVWKYGGGRLHCGWCDRKTAMAAETTGVDIVPGAAQQSARSDIEALRALVVAAGLGWSLVFVGVGLGYQLEMYGDGSLFSYAVAIKSGWEFHWHNIPGRSFVYLFSLVPAETYVALTRDAHGGIVLYGFLFYVAPLLGLIATFAADRSRNRVIFGYACGSTACLCPLVFGFPTETWMAHALFWPALALCHYARRGLAGTALVFAVLLALVFTHEGALIFAAAILASLLLRGWRDAAFWRAAIAFVVVVAIWIAVRAAFPPDDYIAGTLATAARHVFDIGILTSGLLVLLFGALMSYAVAVVVLRRLIPANAHLYAAAIVVLTLAAYWLRFDHALHAENRYHMRTILLIATPALGLLAAASALTAEGRLKLAVPQLPRLLAALGAGATARAVAGAVLLVILVHAVETAKFVTAWTRYKADVQALAMGTASDPALGDARFVSSARIGPDLNRLAWASTTHFLSVLLAPGFAPARLVVDPGRYDYVWLSCQTAKKSEMADRAIPTNSRALVRAHECLYR